MFSAEQPSQVCVPPIWQRNLVGLTLVSQVDMLCCVVDCEAFLFQRSPCLFSQLGERSFDATSNRSEDWLRECPRELRGEEAEG